MRSLSVGLVLLWTALLIPGAVDAAPVTSQQARSRAESFLSAKGRTIDKNMPAKIHGTTEQQTVDALCYIFDVEEGGFVVVSGEDITMSILGYCERGSYDAGNQPEGLQWLLRMYEDQISRLRCSADRISASSRETRNRVIPTRHNIEPLLSTLWNQGNPYNLLCPQYYNQDGSLGDRCATGCVATAIAQVMAYYKYPKTTLRTIPGYLQHFETSQGDKSVQLRNVPANSTINWDDMLDNYNGNETESQQQAVAQLMYWVGLGCMMGYGPSSAAGFPNAVNALVRYFGYDDGTHIESRSTYTLQDWTNLLYNELVTGHPVAFAGTNSGGAHAFVLDGYDVDGLFHVNWGWGGMDNGYFRIDVLDPDDNAGIGASAAPGGYNMGQDAIIGLRLPDDEVAVTKGYKLTVNDWEIRKGNTFFANYVNWSEVDADWNIGIGRVADDGTITQMGNYQTVHINQNYYVSGEFEIRGLDEGTYRIVPVSKRSGDHQWQTHVNPDINYVQAVVDADKQLSLVIHPIEDVEVTEISFPGNHRKGHTQQVYASFRNHGDEYYHEVFLFAGRNNQMGESICRTAVSVGADGESIAVFSFLPQETGTWTVWLAADNEGRNIIGKAMVEINEEGVPRNDNIRYVSTTVANRSNGVIYGNSIQGKVSVLNQGDKDFDGKLCLWLFKLADNGLYYGESKIYVPLSAAAKKVGQASFLFDHLEIDAEYSLSVQYEEGGDIPDEGLKPLGRTRNGVVCWLADNTLKGMPPASFVNIPSNALAVDMRGLGNYVSNVHANSNPNTLYILDQDASLPEGLAEANVVMGQHAGKIHLTDGWGFMSPLTFNADIISYECETGAGKWQTLALPFTVDVLPDGSHLMEFSEVDDNNLPVFTPAASIQRNIPYLYRNDEDHALTFTATDARISVTYQTPMAVGAGDYRFCGTTTGERLDEIMVMGEDGHSLVRSSATVQVAPFRAYLRAPGQVTTITLPDVIDDGIQQVLQNEDRTSVYYNLSGQRVDKPQKGLYILKHKKVIVW